MPVLYAINRESAQVDSPDYLFFCPGCKCGHAVWTTHPNGITKATWSFNGNMEKPTFSPSLKITRHLWTPPVTPENMEEYRKNPWPQTQVEHICHTVITDGKIHFCGDCTHELAGQVVDMVDFDKPEGAK